MAKGSKIALIRDFRCETQESYTEYPVVVFCANVVIDRGDVLYVDGGIIKDALCAAVKDAVVYKDRKKTEEGKDNA